MMNSRVEEVGVHACRTCKRILDWWTPSFNSPPEEGEWRHSIGGGEQNHPVNPAPIEQIEGVIPRCDFCFADDPPWVIKADSFLVAPNTMSVSDWLACDACVGLIQRNDWNGLHRRACEEYEKRRGPGSLDNQSRLWLRRMYSHLRRNLRRAPRKVEE